MAASGRATTTFESREFNKEAAALLRLSVTRKMDRRRTTNRPVWQRAPLLVLSSLGHAARGYSGRSDILRMEKKRTP
uniref:Uncharacterized protein n=1 Tax=Plectus sambesii TaxID=2011161 RepID=A0A914VI65_9BILA